MSAPSPTLEPTAAYRHPIDEVLAALDTDAERGLSPEEVRARLERYGRNELTTEKPVPAWRKFLAQFRDVLVVLLLVATAISAGLWVWERDSALPYEALAIFAVVLLNAILGYAQLLQAGADRFARRHEVTSPSMRSRSIFKPRATCDRAVPPGTSRIRQISS